MNEWIDTKKHLPELNKLYFITDGKDVALAKFSIDNMCWSFLWHYSVFNPTHMIKVELPNIDTNEEKL